MYGMFDYSIDYIININYKFSFILVELIQLLPYQPQIIILQHKIRITSCSPVANPGGEELCSLADAPYYFVGDMKSSNNFDLYYLGDMFLSTTTINYVVQYIKYISCSYIHSYQLRKTRVRKSNLARHIFLFS